MLATGTAGPVNLHLNVLRTDFHFHIIRQVGHDFYGGERGLPPGIGIKGRHPYQAMDTVAIRFRKPNALPTWSSEIGRAHV